MAVSENVPIVFLKGAKIYQGDSLILHQVDFHIDRGEFVYLIGKTGTGKSSLMKTLYGDLPLTTGQGMVNSFSLPKLKKKEIPFLRRSLGIIFQDFQLLSDRSVEDNLLFVLYATEWSDKVVMKERIHEVLSEVGLLGKEYKRTYELSGGEQQRLVIARAMLNRPELIIADEPTGNLDPDTSHEIMDLLFEINKNDKTAFLMATHDYTLIERFPARVVQCADETVSENLDL
ncbi:MAG: phosphonate ABC transporter ATP-binding protein [Saprospirales bacterium]|nr:phosphonate ABC transporter ATP-binding protein [Saprospirales bacterium]|tara:strand:- start:1046 stop:1738 length:693 start_codon:yes stop_codon:yes gene_type:complete